MAFADKRLEMGEESVLHRLGYDLGPDALVGENFEQYGMGHAAVDDMRFADPFGQCVQTGMDFRASCLR